MMHPESISTKQPMFVKSFLWEATQESGGGSVCLCVSVCVCVR